MSDPKELCPDELDAASGGSGAGFSHAYARVSPELCVCCGACASECPSDAPRRSGDAYEIDPDLCVACGACADACPIGAIRIS